jgi:type VII secretion-associated protein (TIGR03931 family)
LIKHDIVLEAGPGTVRHLCCAMTTSVQEEKVTAALDGIDDPLALVDDTPVPIASLWRDVLQSLGCAGRDRLTIVHPSGWAQTRADVVRAAALTLADDVVMRPRSWLLAQASRHAAVVVEIAERLVVVTGTAVMAQARHGEPLRVADAVARAVVEMTPEQPAAVVIDAASMVGGATALSTMITERLRVIGGRAVVEVDDARLRRLAADAVSADEKVPEPQSVDDEDGGDRRRRRALTLTAALVVVAALAASGLTRRGTPVTEAMPTTFLVEGRVALEVPAHWPTRRVVGGLGSARVQVTSPSDPQVALHITQSMGGAQTLAGTAESLKHAIDAEPTGVFVDFNPSASSAGRPAVTYREVRTEHHIRWTVLLAGPVRISIGCQSRPGDDDVVREVCEHAVRTARAIG